MYTARVSTKGGVVIPKELRERYSIEEGTRVEIVAYGDILALIPLPEDPAETLYGILKDGPSLTADLLAERTADSTHEEEPHE